MNSNFWDHFLNAASHLLDANSQNEAELAAMREQKRKAHTGTKKASGGGAGGADFAGGGGAAADCCVAKRRFKVAR